MSVGKVYLVGAGPGDPGLITVAGLERIKQADVIMHDRLVSDALLENARGDAEIIYVGKLPGDSHDQDGINNVLIQKAREGKTVVRLKGGDPYVFGRGGEEGEALRSAGIPFEVVPGITSAIAAPSYAGIPVTHRAVAVSFAVVTGHEDPTKEASGIDWAHLATATDTVVFLMGVKNLPDIVRELTAHGRAPDTPVAVIQWGTTPRQRTVTGTLADIVHRVTDAGLTPPAVTIVGEVVRLRETLSWFDDRPLFGKRVLITRTRRQASVLARLLAEEGAVPVELPAIEIERAADPAALNAGVDELREGRFAWCGFTSANGVEVFFDALAARGLDSRAFGPARVFTIGPATAAALSERGITADLVPAEYVAEAVVEALRPHLSAGDRVFLPRAEAARAELVEGLQTLGAEVEDVPLYRAALPADTPPEALEDLREGRIDIVTFTSSSTVRNLVTMLGDDARVLTGESRPLIACIGPITAGTARELGLTVDIMATEYTVEGLVAALKEHVPS